MNSITPWLQRFWDWRAAGNFIGGGIGSGLLVWAAVLSLAGYAVEWLLLLGLGVIGVGLFCVFLELGRPWRAINVLFNARTSWMTREAMVAAALFPLGLLAVLTGSVILTLLTALAGMGFLYCQGRILQAAKGIPAWRIATLPPLIASTALCEGLGLFLVLSPLLDIPVTVIATSLLLMLLGARFFAWGRYRNSLTQHAPLACQDAATQINAQFVRFGAILPALLAIAQLLIGNGTPWLAALSGLCALLAGGFVKFHLLNSLAFNQGYAISHSPTRGAGRTGPSVKPGWPSGHLQAPVTASSHPQDTLAAPIGAAERA